jgi:hypothetical protein
MRWNELEWSRPKKKRIFLLDPARDGSRKTMGCYRTERLWLDPALSGSLVIVCLSLTLPCHRMTVGPDVFFKINLIFTMINN